MNTPRTFLLAAAAAACLAACDKDEATAPPTADDRAAARLAVEQSLAIGAAFTGGFDLVTGEAERNGDLSGLRVPGGGETEAAPAGALAPRSCGTTAFTATEGTFFPATLELRFGESCTDAFGRVLGGTLRATFDGLLHEPGTRIDLDLVDYVVGGLRLTGDYSIVNTGADAQGRPTFRHDIVGGRVTYPDGAVVAYDEVVTSVVAEGAETTFWNAGVAGLTDDVYEDTRAATLVGPGGNTFSVTTPVALRRPTTCAKVVSGRYDVTSSAFPQTAELDFGDGACDAVGTVSYGGERWEVRL